MSQEQQRQRRLDSALRQAVIDGNFTRVKKLVKKGANVNASDNVLHTAAFLGHLDIVRYLVEQDANVNAENDIALRAAARKNHLDIVCYLVEQGANVNADNDRALRDAALDRHLEIVKYLVEKGANVNADDDIALCVAVESGDPKLVKYLVEKGADYSKIKKHCFPKESWSQEKLRELFNLDFMASHFAAAQHFWNILSADQKTESLRKHYKMNNYLALQHLRKGNKPRRLQQNMAIG